jgi:hypothetical protein
MRGLYFVLLAIIFSACQKPAVSTLPPDPPPAITPIPTPAQAFKIVTSVTINNLANHLFTIDSFDYDIDKRMAAFHSWNYDSSQTPAFTDSTSIQFYFQTNDSVPYQYTIVTKKPRDNFYSAETHQLFYDQQRRIIRDTLLNPVNNISAVNTYSYVDPGFVYNIFQTGKALGNKMEMIETDTTVIYNGNIIKDNAYLLQYNPFVSHAYFYIYSSSNYENPFYLESTATTIGPLLDNLLSTDFTSKNLIAMFQQIDPITNYKNTINYTWATDSSGKVVRGSYGLGNFIYRFHYK